MNRPGIRLSLILLACSCQVVLPPSSLLRFTACKLFSPVIIRAVIVVRLVAWCSAWQFVELHWPLISPTLKLNCCLATAWYQRCRTSSLWTGVALNVPSQRSTFNVQLPT
ncbi:hypothetical protein EV424DRAFT_619573 [Suillus variegatus]|nr:hypothetical protein EV424DRAFT_619573 [Suillus variegatus]